MNHGRKSEAEALKDLSSRMLSGWRLLAETCPIRGCSTPLVVSPDGRQTWCAMCVMEVISADSDDKVPAPMDAQKENFVEKNAIKVRGTQELNSIHSVGGRGDRDAASQRMGTKLLRGWTMLEESCDKCMTPLFRSPKKDEEELFCCGCDRYVGNLSEEEEEEEEPLITNSNDLPNSKNQNEGIKESSATLSRHLLDGWAMLAETCPKCHSPLMRKQDTTLCVQDSCIIEQTSPVVEKNDNVSASSVKASALAITANKVYDVIQTKLAQLLSTLTNCDLTQTIGTASAIANLGRAAKSLAHCQEVILSHTSMNRSSLHMHIPPLIAKLNSCGSTLAATEDLTSINNAALAISALTDALLTLIELR